MAGPFFDVFVVGAADATPAGQAALIQALSGPLGMPATLITKGLAERKLCAGKGLVQADAQSLVRELKAMGANTVIRPTSPSDTPTRLAAPPTRPPAAARREPPPPPTLSTAPPTMLSTAPPITVNDPFAPPPSGPQGLSLGSGPKSPLTDASAFAPPPSSADIGLGLGALATGAGPSLAAPPVAHNDHFGGTPDEDPALELDLAPSKATISTEHQRPSGSSSLPGASALNLNKMAASSSASGLSVDKAVAAEAYRVRCDKHGLLYDTRRASGCGMCMDKGRKLSAAIDAKAAGVKLADFGDNAIKRAFVGLALALVVGFIPAAYHAYRLGARDIHRLRDEQEVLSRKPATEEILRRFQELDVVVDSQTTRSTRTTGILWLVVAGGTLIGWYRVTI